MLIDAPKFKLPPLEKTIYRGNKMQSLISCSPYSSPDTHDSLLNDIQEDFPSAFRRSKRFKTRLTVASL